MSLIFLQNKNPVTKPINKRNTKGRMTLFCQEAPKEKNSSSNEFMSIFDCKYT